MSSNNNSDGQSISNATNQNSSTANGTGGWLGLDSTQVLIIFLIIVAAVLVIFLLIYYYVIKGMRKRSVNRLLQKSASGSIGEEKARNIFANPERQLAVDQSTKMNPDSPASASSYDQQQPSSAPVSAEKEDLASKNHPSHPSSVSNTSDGQMSTALTPVGSRHPSQISGKQGSKINLQFIQSDSQMSKADKKASNSKKSNSSGKRQRGKSGENQTTYHGVSGALAGVRNALKDTDQE